MRAIFAALLVPCVALQLGCSTTIGGDSGDSSSAGTNGGASATGGSAGTSAGGGGSTSTGGDAGTSGAPNGGTGGTTMPACTTPDVINPGRSPTRRLNGFEYDNTVHDLTGTTKKYSITFPIDEQAPNSGFSNSADNLVVNDNQAKGYQEAAEEMAAAAVANLGALAPACNPSSTGADTCARSFIQAFGKQAFRRPVTDEELTRYQALFTTGSTGATFNDGVSLVIEAMLQSPNFLYRLEFGDPTATGDVLPLTPYELATRISYFLWSTMPDDELFVAADAGQLATSDQVAMQTQRMLPDPRAKAMVRQFHREWAEIERAMMSKVEQYYPNYTTDLAAQLVFEADVFMEDVFWSNGSLNTLLTAPYTFMNGAVATHYGVTGITGDQFVKVDLNPAQRSGFLTSGAFLAGHASGKQTSPIHRGKFVREHLLCQPVDPPPNDIMITPPEPTPETTTRQRYENHRTDDRCAGCHTYMDPIGFVFEHLDGVGKWRDMDNGFAVNATGEILEPPAPELGGPIDGVVELAGKLVARQDIVGDCVALHWFRWGNGRLEDQSTAHEDACSIDSIRQKFRASNYDMRTLPVAIVTADAFRYRKRVAQ